MKSPAQTSLCQSWRTCASVFCFLFFPSLLFVWLSCCTLFVSGNLRPAICFCLAAFTACRDRENNRGRCNVFSSNRTFRFRSLSFVSLCGHKRDMSKRHIAPLACFSSSCTIKNKCKSKYSVHLWSAGKHCTLSGSNHLYGLFVWHLSSSRSQGWPSSEPGLFPLSLLYCKAFLGWIGLGPSCQIYSKELWTGDRLC